MVIVMIIETLPLSSSRKKYLCRCNSCYDFFTRRTDYRNFDLCIFCANIKAGLSRKTHGKNNKNCRLHVTWQNMKRRCMDPKNKKYESYGGAGITVCDDWLDFSRFMLWANNNGYNDALTIDRENNAKGYYPGNCRFVCISTQNANRGITAKNKTGYIGVSIQKTGIYRATVNWKGSMKCLGYHGDPKNAARIRDDYIKENNLPHQLNF